MLLGFGHQYGVPPDRAAMAVPLLFAIKTQCLYWLPSVPPEDFSVQNTNKTAQYKSATQTKATPPHNTIRHQASSQTTLQLYPSASLTNVHNMSLMPGFVLAKAPNSASLWRAGADFDDPDEPRSNQDANRELLMQ
eukprot:2150997-Rhodomonas_salina.1